MWTTAIICEDMSDIREAFRLYLQMVKEYEPNNIVEVLPASYSVEMDETWMTGWNAKYVFTDEYMARWLEREGDHVEITDKHSFFEMMVEGYKYY